ncbi:hypothetical protein Syun_019313 [Stephania yunnanensis]|uniref:Beta-Casp domain-containing protein n=1 Tax=Stephania yunnanensis TaxID=152371 RepID=A0AAP0IWA0_9MAGN
MIVRHGHGCGGVETSPSVWDDVEASSPTTFGYTSGAMQRNTSAWSSHLGLSIAAHLLGLFLNASSVARIRLSFINAYGPCVLFASPGMISGGFSLEVFKQWAPSEKNLIALPGVALSLFSKANHDTQNSIKEEPRATSGHERAGRAKRRRRIVRLPGGGRRRSGVRAVAADDRGGDQCVGGTGGRGVGGSRGRGALLMASGGGLKEGGSGAGGEYRAAAAAPEENTEQRLRRQLTLSIGQGSAVSHG